MLCEDKVTCSASTFPDIGTAAAMVKQFHKKWSDVALVRCVPPFLLNAAISGRTITLVRLELERGGEKTPDIYKHASHNDFSVNGGPHIRRWSHNIIL